MLYIITPCSRPQNLQVISKTIPIDSRWIICSDQNLDINLTIPHTHLKCKQTGKFGIKARNYVLDNFTFQNSDHILFHDDDNIIHSKLYSVISQYFDYDFSIMCWGQLNKDNSIRLEPSSNPKRYKIDTASYLIKWKYNKFVRHQEDLYIHDGIYAEDCSKNGPIFKINDYLCYYNFL